MGSWGENVARKKKVGPRVREQQRAQRGFLQTNVSAVAFTGQKEGQVIVLRVGGKKRREEGCIVGCRHGVVVNLVISWHVRLPVAEEKGLGLSFGRAFGAARWFARAFVHTYI